jgi:hypothetical protein
MRGDYNTLCRAPTYMPGGRSMLWPCIPCKGQKVFLNKKGGISPLTVLSLLGRPLCTYVSRKAYQRRIKGL